MNTSDTHVSGTYVCLSNIQIYVWSMLFTVHIHILQILGNVGYNIICVKSWGVCHFVQDLANDLSCVIRIKKTLQDIGQ